VTDEELKRCKVIYRDRGISRGMQIGIDDAVAAGRPIEYRKMNMEIPRVAPTSAPMITAARRHMAEIKAQRGLGSRE